VRLYVARLLGRVLRGAGCACTGLDGVGVKDGVAAEREDVETVVAHLGDAEGLRYEGAC
jgi:hypothetical protein